MAPGEAALERARALIAVRRHDEALGALGPAVADPATAYEAHCLTAQAQLGRGDRAAALRASEAALGVHADDDWAHRLRAVALSGAGRRKPALAAAEEAARLNPWLPESLHLLALLQAENRQRQAARATVATLLERHPDHPLAHETAAEIALLDRQLPRAESHLREALRLDPQDADVARRLGDVLRRQKRPTDAVDAYLASASIDPTSHETRRSLGRIGLPVAGAGLLGLKASGFVVVRALAQLPLVAAYAVVVAVFALVAVTVSLLRRRGDRMLPEHVAASLRTDHRDAALRLLWWLGLLLVPLVVLAVTGRHLVTAGVVALGVLGCLLVPARLRRGPARRPG